MKNLKFRQIGNLSWFKICINTQASLEFNDFIEFYEARRLTLKGKLMQILNVKVGVISIDAD